jgi:crotonobetainyl-CoA:carnitine CoA-transferase CaiB-like acyl-CoA transferase
MPTADEGRPLSGYTVVELGQIVAGPITSLTLADLGAEVVKVERPGGGDRMRTAGGAIFQTLNRNKRSITLDLKSDEGREVYHRLVSEADVVVENLGPDAVERLVIGYDDLREDNPGLVYLSIKGFFEGPYGDRASMDVVAEAMSGFMQMTGEADGKPLRAGTSIADIAAGMFGAIGIVTALLERERTGEGQKVTATLFESMTNWMWYWAAFTQFQGQDPDPLGASHPAMAIYDVFESRDGEWLFIGVVSQGQYESLCAILDREDLVTDERYETHAKRLERTPEMVDIVQSEIDGWDRDDILEACYEGGIPAAPISDPSDLVDDPQLRSAGMLTESERDDGGSFQAMLTPIVGDRIRPASARNPPALGEHVDEVLADLGFDAAEIADLREAGAFGD